MEVKISVEAQEQFLQLAKQQKDKVDWFGRRCDALGLAGTASGLFLAVTLWNITHHSGISILAICAPLSAWSLLRDLNRERKNSLKHIINEFQNF